MVGAIGPLFRTAGHKVRTQHAVTASAGQRRRDVEIRYYLQDTAGRWSLVFDLSMTHDRFGSSRHVHQKGLKKIHSYRWQALFLAPTSRCVRNAHIFLTANAADHLLRRSPTRTAEHLLRRELVLTVCPAVRNSGPSAPTIQSCALVAPPNVSHRRGRRLGDDRWILFTALTLVRLE